MLNAITFIRVVVVLFGFCLFVVVVILYPLSAKFVRLRSSTFPHKSARVRFCKKRTVDADKDWHNVTSYSGVLSSRGYGPNYMIRVVASDFHTPYVIFSHPVSIHSLS